MNIDDQTSLATHLTKPSGRLNHLDVLMQFLRHRILQRSDPLQVIERASVVVELGMQDPLCLGDRDVEVDPVTIILDVAIGNTFSLQPAKDRLRGVDAGPEHRLQLLAPEMLSILRMAWGGNVKDCLFKMKGILLADSNAKSKAKCGWRCTTFRPSFRNGW